MIARHYLLDKLGTIYKKRYGNLTENSLMNYNMMLGTACTTSFYVNCFDQSTNAIPIVSPLNLNVESYKGSFADICDRRAKSIIDQAKQSNKKIIVLWSGGIDSHLILVALLRNGATVSIASTAQSILEHPKFYENFIKDKIEIIYYHDLKFNPQESKDVLYIGSAMADTLVGGSIIVHYLYANYEQAQRKILHNGNININDIAKFWQMFGKNFDNRYAEIFVEQVKIAADKLNTDISTWWQFWNFADMIYRSSYDYWYHWPQYHHHGASSGSLANLDSWDIHFFMHEEFYDWALHKATLEDKIGNSVFTYKKAYKDYIYQFDRDENYRNFKLKVNSNFSSLPTVYTKNYVGLDDSFNIIADERLEELLSMMHKQDSIKT